jgi:alkyldihydroxyacetonephosphate synthase
MFASFEGDAQSVAYQRRRFETIAGRYGARRWADAEALRLWRFQGRYLRDSLLERGVGVERFDVSAPWSTLQSVYESTRAGLEMALRETAPREGAHGVVLCQVRHATSSGATLAFTAVFPRAIGSDLEQADKIEAAAFQAILTSGGTPHRGLGPAKAAQLSREKGEAAVAIMRAIKETVDPKDVLAPGRLLP